MLYPHDIQAAVLFDRRVDGLEAVVKAFQRVEEARTGTQFNIPEATPGIFYRLFGPGQLNVTFEYVDRPADMSVFQQPLGSAVTGIVCPDVRQRLAANRSLILVNASHGVLGHTPQLAHLMAELGRPMEGASLPEFRRRLDICALAARIVCDHASPQLVHWTQSNQLLPADMFDGFAQAPAPNPIHVHPFLFGQADGGDGKALIGIRTFGVRHFIGREVLVQPSILPWAANYETILAFLRVATVEKGYVIPHQDTFGPEDRSLSYRVLHRDADPDDVPLYELVPLMHREYGFEAEDYVSRDRVINDRSPPAALMPEDQDAKTELVNEWREARALAEGIGGTFEVRARAARPDPSSGPGGPGGPASSRIGNRPVFGRKRA